jgi:transposase InsO family protein/transposase-like protein
MLTKYRTYDRLFKEKAVLLSYERISLRELEKELEISLSLLSKWRKQYEKSGIEAFCGRGNGYLRVNPVQLKINMLERKAKRSEIKYEILKKGTKYLSKGRLPIYRFIENNEIFYSAKKMCIILGIGEKSYHRWKNKFVSETKFRAMQRKEEITSIFFAAKKRYGSYRITKELRHRGHGISRVTVSKYMAELSLHKKSNRKYKITTDSNHNHYIAPNLLNRQFCVKEPSKAWVSDITYIPNIKGFLHLTIVLDLFDRKIIGWSLSSGLTAEMTTIPAWEMAVKNREITNGLIFHSDRGVQYANKKFTDLVDSSNTVKRSMSQSGNCLDNAVAESFFSTLKRELIYRNKLLTQKRIKMEIFDFIENWYNKERIHSTLNYKTIEEFGKINTL